MVDTAHLAAILCTKRLTLILILSWKRTSLQKMLLLPMIGLPQRSPSMRMLITLTTLTIRDRFTNLVFETRHNLGEFDTLVLSMQVEPGRYWVSFRVYSLIRNHNSYLRIVKTGNLMSSYYFDIDQQKWVLYNETEISFRNTFYRVGLNVYSAYAAGGLLKGVYSDVKITISGDTSIDNWELYQ